MDLKFSNAEPFADERDAVDRLLGTSESGWHGGERDEKDHRRAHSGRSQSRRHLVMEALHAVNDRVGWISPGALNYIGKRLGIAAADVYSVATFYAMFSTNMRPKRIVHVCTDIACMARGSKEVCADLEKRLGPAGAMSGWKHSPCLGVCERAPAALAVEAGDPPHEHLIGPATADEVVLALNNGPVALAAEAPPGMAGCASAAGAFAAMVPAAAAAAPAPVTEKNLRRSMERLPDILMSVFEARPVAVFAAFKPSTL